MREFREYSIFELKEGHIYTRYKIRNQWGKSWVYKRQGNMIYQSKVTKPLRWSPSLGVRVKDAFRELEPAS